MVDSAVHMTGELGDRVIRPNIEPVYENEDAERWLADQLDPNEYFARARHSAIMQIFPQVLERPVVQPVVSDEEKRWLTNDLGPNEYFAEARAKAEREIRASRESSRFSWRLVLLHCAQTIAFARRTHDKRFRLSTVKRLNALLRRY